MWVAGCAAAPPPPPKPEPAPITVAVIEFGDVGRAAEDGCVMAVLDAGFRVVGRKQIDAALPNDDLIDYRKLGQVLGADMIVDGGLARGLKVRRSPPARLVSTRTGNLLAETKIAGRIDRGFKVGRRVCEELLKQLP